MIPVELIRQKDYPAIVDWALSLTETERITALKELHYTGW